MLCMPYKRLSWKQFQTEHALRAREHRDQQHRHSYWQHTWRLFRRRRRQHCRAQDNYILLKSNEEYFNDPVCKNGYFRGVETYNFVKEVMNRGEVYKKKIKD